MKRSTTIASLAGAAVVAAGAYVYVNKLHATSPQQATEAAEKTTTAVTSQPVLPPAITVSKVVSRAFVETAPVSGSLIAREEVLVSPEVDGFRVVALYADEGDTVKKGEVLARLASEQLDAQVAQNAAALARADAAIAQAKSVITQAAAQAKEAKAQLARAEPLRKSGFLSQTVFDQRESAARTTEAQLAASKDALIAAEAEKSQVTAQQREITWRQSKTDVTSPEDGLISRRAARIGALATTAADPMFRIIAKGEVELDAEVVETRLPKIKIGQTAKIALPEAGTYDGTVRLISPEVNATTRLGRVRIFIGADPALRIGAFAHADIETARSTGLAVPNSAVTFRSDGTYVQVVENNVVRQRRVETGLVSGEFVEVTKGLTAGDLVVTRSGTFLRDGDQIRAVQPAAQLSEAK